MEPKEIRTLKILEKVEGENLPSQRDLARELNISLGLVNSFIKRLAIKGYVKITTIPRNRIKYILTPKGAAEKTRLTYEYIQHSYKFYKEARQKLRDLYGELEKEGVTRIVFYGAGDLAEIAYLSLQESNLELVAVVDDAKKGKRFMRLTIQHPAFLEALSFDRILVTSLNSTNLILDKLSAMGISAENVVVIR